MMETEYRDIPNFPGYRAGSDGSIWSHRHAPRKLKADCRIEDGRARYTLKHASGRYVRRYGSHFVLFAFVGPRPDGMEACHDDGNCLNDASDNLRWDTPVENKADMRRHGTQVGGETHPKAKLRDSDIPLIISRRAAGERLRSIGQSFGVSEQRIFQICKKGTR